LPAIAAVAGSAKKTPEEIIAKEVAKSVILHGKRSALHRLLAEDRHDGSVHIERRFFKRGAELLENRPALRGIGTAWRRRRFRSVLALAQRYQTQVGSDDEAGKESKISTAVTSSMRVLILIMIFSFLVNDS
jgi:hypothetical protein